MGALNYFWMDVKALTIKMLNYANSSGMHQVAVVHENDDYYYNIIF